MTDLPNGNTILSRDLRPILSIIWNDGEESHHTVGNFGVTRIIAYDECGEMSNVPWLAVFVGETIITRVAARYVTVVYKALDAE